MPSTVQIFIAAKPIDMRLSIDGLAAVARDYLVQDPLSGHLFVFFNHVRDRVKILFWDRSGFCMYYKRLELGSFRVPRPEAGSRSIEIDVATLTLLLEGIDLRSARRCPRFVLADRQKAQPPTLTV
jgi:transposase